MTIQWRLRWAAVIATSLIGIVGETLANSIQNYPFQYGDVFWIVGLALVPFLAVPSWRNGAVDEMFPELVMRPLHFGSDVEGWHCGRSAADRAAISAGAPVEHCDRAARR